MSVFYVLHVKEKSLSDCLDAIRFLSNPAEKQRAHITVRGPYQRRIDIRSVNDKVAGKIVSIDGVDNFFAQNQNTVFFHCSAPVLTTVWKKSDFPFNPHLTIYDGRSAEFAHRLYDILSGHTYSLRFRADELDAIESKKGQNSLALALSFNSKLVRKAVGEKITADEVPNLSSDRRLELIGRLCEYLSELGTRRGSREEGRNNQSSLPFAPKSIAVAN